eukprot:Seg460.16 transcript_id=Seg460.16/GoldUCD/mRNA.D3Y31 product="hypothetical protein" protein_id=Seg460.16/GoldUCD/D3Y31
MYRNRHYAGIPPEMGYAARSISLARAKTATEHEMSGDDEETDNLEEAEGESRCRTCQHEMPAQAKLPTEHTITTGEPTEVAVAMQLTQAVNSVLLARTGDENSFPDENEIGDDPMRPRQSRVPRRYTHRGDETTRRLFQEAIKDQASVTQCKIRNQESRIKK